MYIRKSNLDFLIFLFKTFSNTLCISNLPMHIAIKIINADNIYTPLYKNFSYSYYPEEVSYASPIVISVT